MAWQVLRYQLTSDCPMLMHAATTVDPLHPLAKELKRVSGKKAKTDADHEMMARIEFMAGLYMGKDGPIIPAANIDAMLIRAAAKVKEGTIAKTAIYCKASAPMQYDGPRDADALWACEQFRHRCRCKVGMASVMRTRPVFNEWSAVVELAVETSTVNPSQVDAWFAIAGQQVGLGDWRPQHGRFSVVRIP